MKASGYRNAVQCRGPRRSEIERSAYEIYKKKWIEDHHVSKEEQCSILADFLGYRDSWKDEHSVKEFGSKTAYHKAVPTFESFLSEMGGFSVGLYASFEEFKDNEFKDTDYMCDLLADNVELYDAWASNESIAKDLPLLSAESWLDYSKNEGCDEEMEDEYDRIFS